LLRQAREFNDAQPQHLLGRLLATGQLRSGDKLAILGAAYKADIDDARESPAALLAQAARSAGIEVSVHDPLVRAGDHHGLLVSNHLASCLHGAAAAVLLTEHKWYRTLSSPMFAEHMTGRLIGDARNWLNHPALRRAGFTVIELGIDADRQAAARPRTPVAGAVLAKQST
jgi:UDP-N-acetyl-D-mannosaminuronate dehydrogenase